MNVNNLKFLAGTVVYKSGKLSEASKIQLLNFIKEADSHQIMALLLDRKIMKLDETAKAILEDRFENSKYNEIINEIAPKTKTYLSLTGAGFYGLPFIIYRKIRSLHDACTKKCGTYEFNTIRRQVCLVRCNIAEKELILAQLRKTNASPDKITKVETQIKKLSRKLKEYDAHAKKRGTKY